MNTLSSTGNVQEPKVETRQNKDTYRAPRLVTLGTAAGLVQAGCPYAQRHDYNYTSWCR